MRSPAIHLRAVWLLCVGLSLIPLEGRGQDEGPSLRRTEEPVQIAVDPAYQYYVDDGRALTQLSTSLAAIVPISRRFTVQGQASVARAGGDNLSQVPGLTDVRTGILYSQPTGDGSIVASLHTTIPVGKTGLSPQALQTTRITSQNYYDFHVSSFGSGFSVSPQVTWAVPLTERLVAGIGVSYRHQRGFRPRQGMSSLYVPGDETRVNGGFDYKLTRSSALGVDVSVSRYATDQVGDTNRFDAGLRASGTVRYLYRQGFTTVRVVGRYANWGENELFLQSGRGRRGAYIPSHAMGQVLYRARLVEGIRLRTTLGGHWYTGTDVSTRQYFSRLRLRPSIALAESLLLMPHGGVRYGTYWGLEGGMRIEVRL